jgi:hypothetical protein
VATLCEFSVTREVSSGLKRDLSRDTGSGEEPRTPPTGFLIFISDADDVGVSNVAEFFLSLLVPAVKTSSTLTSAIIITIIIMSIIIFIVAAVDEYHVL